MDPVNDAPVASKDSYTTEEDASLNVAAPGVLANDTDADGDALTAELVSTTSNGDLTLNNGGSFTYTPDADFNGPDSFTYKANDGSADSGVATVSISVTAANDAPTVTVDGGGRCGAASDSRGTINLSLLDPDRAPEEITLSATSSNPRVVPEENILFGGGTDTSRTLTLTDVKGSGTSTLVVRATDGRLLSDPLSVVVESGTSAKDALIGTANADMIFAKKGSDTASGRGANDLLCGGNDKDRLSGGLGADRFGGGQGIDTARDYDAAEGDTKAGIEDF